MTEQLFYPPKAVLGDYARALVGIAFTGGPALSLGTWSFAHWILVPLCLLFVAFAFRTWQRQQTRIAWDETGLSLSRTTHASLRWDEVRSLKVAFYATNRDRTGGWMQLTIRSDRTTAKADSGAENFAALAARAAKAAQALGLPIDPTTHANLTALGIHLPPASDTVQA
jgi:hypothetical protein